MRVDMVLLPPVTVRPLRFDVVELRETPEPVPPSASPLVPVVEGRPVEPIVELLLPLTRGVSPRLSSIVPLVDELVGSGVTEPLTVPEPLVDAPEVLAPPCTEPPALPLVCAWALVMNILPLRPVIASAKTEVSTGLSFFMSFLLLR